VSCFFSKTKKLIRKLEKNRSIQMKMLLSFFAVCFAVIGICHGSGNPEESIPGVMDLDESNFDSIVNGQKLALVEFYAPWCGHCKHLVPELKSLSSLISSDASIANRVVIAKVNADKYKSLGARFGVKGFPTIKAFARGQSVDEPTDYQGPRSANNFLDFIKAALDNDKTFGRVESMDVFVQEFISAGDNKQVIFEKASAAAEEGDSEIYIKIMKKAMDKGDDYYVNEKNRLNGMIDSGNVSAEKVETFMKKLSVLAVFHDDEL